VAVLGTARSSFEELTGLTAESVSSVERDGDGWAVQIEALELSRTPDSASLLGSYEVTLDASGEVTGFHRVGRYERGKAGGG
jgi:Gas vesicle synthesis protein GvpO